MLIFAAITPHPPILIPSIGKSNLDKISKTREAMEDLADELYALQPDTIIVVSPHGLVDKSSFTIQVSDRYHGDFHNFGDLETTFDFNSDISLINKIKIGAESHNIPISLVSESAIDHGSLVPLYYLTKNLPKIKIIPIAFSLLDYDEHLRFGKYLRRAISMSNKRIALIASGDLSHCTTKDAPAKYSPKGEVFDKKILQILEKKQCKKLIDLDKGLIEEAKECGLRSIITIAGALEDVQCSPKLLSYESPFGVGYMVMNFNVI